MENKSDVIASLWPIGVAVGQGQRGLWTLTAALHFFLSYLLLFSSSLTLKNPVGTLRQTGFFLYYYYLYFILRTETCHSGICRQLRGLRDEGRRGVGIFYVWGGSGWGSVCKNRIFFYYIFLTLSTFRNGSSLREGGRVSWGREGLLNSI